MTPPERFEIRQLARRIVELKDGDRGGLISLIEDLDPETIVDLATELIRLDGMRETWECAECGREWCGTARPLNDHTCKPTMLVTT